MDVARESGVSQSTVSRVFSDDKRIIPETKARVLAVAQELGYRPNASARSLITRRTNLVGLITSDLTNPFYPLILEAFTAQFHKVGQRVILFTAGTGEELDDLLPDILSSQVDGFVVASASLSSAVVRECLRAQTPVVLFNRTAPDSGASQVGCDNIGGGRLVADVLLDAGHSRPAFIAGRGDASTSRDRERGFVERLAERGITDVLREGGSFTYQSGFDGATRLLKHSDAPDAIFCANDITAMGCLDAARDLGLRVPQDLAVVGFDDIPAAAWSAYRLTTVRQPLGEMIRRSTIRLLELIETSDSPPTLEVMPGQLVRRGSTRPSNFSRSHTGGHL
ncbi:LacI family DNA-binding transcriptional regulator [Deinococcus frigens]|uniref:LacI family DNA-binding transcriptional regulator n=1 Tax=Deinococcus frigens TaxID=249403 RepID=UPI00138E359B|nr:LacI family DNA-binding transcriptional regulator [Deinococcus frigens]